MWLVVCPNATCRCSNVELGSCSIDPPFAENKCNDSLIFSALVAGPYWSVKVIFLHMQKYLSVCVLYLF